MDDVGLGEEDPVRRVLHDYFAWATPMVNRFERSAEDAPDDLAITRWSGNRLTRPSES
jgi:hemoglobin